MQKFSWQNLKRPFLVLAPMEDVTDIVFRQMIIKTGRPDVFFTEFTSTDGLFSEGALHTLRRLQFSPVEKPIIAQIWGNNPANYFKAGKLIREMGFDGLDINMGCPDKAIIKHGCCGALIDNQSLAKELIHAARQGAEDLPIGVKTRIGVKEIKTESWISFLLAQDLQALTIHGRTVSEKSKVPARWDEIAKAVSIRNGMGKDTVIIGNGDITSFDSAMDQHAKYGVDGVMIGRGIFQNPWIFNRHIDPAAITPSDKLQLLIDHIQQFNNTWGDTKPFDIMKKFYKIYISDIPNAHNFRMELMDCKTPRETILRVQEKYEFLCGKKDYC